MKTLYRLEVRPLTLSPWKKVLVFNSKTEKYEPYTLRRGRWYTGFRRRSDNRVVFAGKQGTTRLNTLKWASEKQRELRRRGFATRLVPVEVAKYPHLRGDLDAQHKLLDALNDVAGELGVKIDVISGRRTIAEQQFLYDLYLAGKGNLAAKPNPNAPHVLGIAADAYVKGVALANVDGAVKALAKRGVGFPVPGEKWHAEIQQ